MIDLHRWEDQGGHGLMADVRVDLDVLEPAILSAIHWLQQERRLHADKCQDLHNRISRLEDLLRSLNKEREGD